MDQKAVWLSSQTNELIIVRYAQAQLKQLPRISYCHIEVNLVDIYGSKSQFTCIQTYRVLVWQYISMN